MNVKNHPVIRQYARTLSKSFQGLQKRPAMNEFYNTSELVLNDNPSLDYETLVSAMGSPEECAATLQERHPYRPVPLGMKLGLVLIVACLVVGGFALYHVITAESPEIMMVYTDPKEFSHESIPDPINALVDDFNPRDSSWGQSEECPAYILEAHNENSVPAQVLVRYRENMEPHIFLIPPGETYVLAVNDALPGEHVISFDASDHTYDGFVEVYVSETPLP